MDMRSSIQFNFEDLDIDIHVIYTFTLSFRLFLFMGENQEPKESIHVSITYYNKLWCSSGHRHGLMVFYFDIGGDSSLGSPVPDNYYTCLTIGRASRD